MRVGPFPLAHLRLDRLAALWPEASPLLCLAGTGRYAVVALSWREVEWEEVAARPVAARGGKGEGAGARQEGLPFVTGYVGLVPYDLYAAADGKANSAPRVFRVEQALVHDRAAGVLHITGAPCPVTGFTTVDWGPVVAGLTASPMPEPADSSALTLTATASDNAYERQVCAVLEDIRDGRYYQLNLLRYFAVGERPNRRWAGARLDRFAGDFAAWFSLPDLQLISFSPERFVRCSADGEHTQVQAFPIKGTASRHLADPARDAAQAIALQQSPKDRAELHMIIDLMRHDLYGASLPGTIQVLHPGRLLSLASVYHLEAEVRARLRPGLTIGQLLAAVCPGGSITGAPKKEVMLAIRSYEERPRGYFMGHAFYAADGGGFDASILIRTLVQEGDGPFAFAAGGGLVIGSEPGSERREIAAKCGVVTLG